MASGKFLCVSDEQAVERLYKAPLHDAPAQRDEGGQQGPAVAIVVTSYSRHFAERLTFPWIVCCPNC